MKITSLFLCSLLTATLNASAQRTAEAPVAGIPHEWPAPVTIVCTNDSAYTKPGYINNISMHAVRDFTRRFPAGMAPLWFNVSKGWVAKFTAADIQYQVAYTRNGSWTYTMRSYAEKLLPHDIRHLVRSTYYDYRIVGVTQVEQFNFTGTAYIVYLEDEKSYMTLSLQDGEMTVMEELNKPVHH